MADPTRTSPTSTAAPNPAAGSTTGQVPSSDIDRRAEDVVARVLARAGTALQDETTAGYTDFDGEQLDVEERGALQRIGGLSTELTDVTEVEYRQLRLEKVVLVGLYSGSGPRAAEAAEISLRELAALAETAGSQVLDGVLQRRHQPDPGTYLGSGKAAELADVVAASGADTVVVDTELAPSQRRGLEDVVKVKVIDRTALILDIFAQHAKSREGKAQVELAQLEYLLPRLRGWGDSMSRQAGGRVAAGGAGMGSRGPGETKIELDRRRIRTRMARLRRQIKEMAPARDTKRRSRREGQVPSVAIVGYTNAGKSSLLNRLTGAGVLVQNALFATLDPTVRRTETPDGRQYTISDTVGFVRSLPTQLVEAFRSTLEEVAGADVVLHVVDASHPDPEGQLAAVRDTLRDIEGVTRAAGAGRAQQGRSGRARDDRTAAAPGNGGDRRLAKTGAGFEELRQRLAELLPRPSVEIDVVVPYQRGDLVHRAHTSGEVLSEEHTADGTRLRALVDGALAAELERVGA